MSENIGEQPGDDTSENETYNSYSVDDEDQPQGDGDSLVDDRGLTEPLDEGYSPPEKPSTLIRHGEHETLDERLSEEIPEPDPYSEDDVDEDDNLTVRADEERLDDGEVGDQRAGRLVDPDEGLGLDEDKDLIGEDVGIDAGAASAEEAAMHIVPE